MDGCCNLALKSPFIEFEPESEYSADTRHWQGIPGIERAPNGRLWACWYSGAYGEGAGNYVVLVTSDDDGESWSEAVLIVDPKAPVRAYDPALWHDPLGRLWLFWAQSQGLFDGRSGVWAIVTEDSSAPKPVWSDPFRICDGIMMNKPTVLSTGEWLLPAAVWSCMGGEYFDCPEIQGSSVVCSIDNGNTWSVRGKAHVPDVSFDEHMVVERSDGNLWMLVRTKYGIGESCSFDRGATWTPGKPSNIPHVDSRFNIRRLKNGSLMLVRHNPPDGISRSHLAVYLSNDDGITWQQERMLDEKVGVSYPDSVESEDGAVYIIYDYDRQGVGQIIMQKSTDSKVRIVSQLKNNIQQP